MQILVEHVTVSDGTERGAICVTNRASFPCKFSDLRPLTSPRKLLNVMEGKA